MDETLFGTQMAFFLMIAGIALAIGFLINVFVCWLLYSAYQGIPVEHRRMEPGLVWLLLIPCFSLIWYFFVLPKLARSFRSAFEARGEMEHGDCGEAIGWWTAGCCAGGLIPCLGYVSSLAYLVLLIIYLVKINGLREQLAALANPRS